MELLEPAKYGIWSPMEIDEKTKRSTITKGKSIKEWWQRYRWSIEDPEMVNERLESSSSIRLQWGGNRVLACKYIINKPGIYHMHATNTNNKICMIWQLVAGQDGGCCMILWSQSAENSQLQCQIWQAANTTWHSGDGIPILTVSTIPQTPNTLIRYCIGVATSSHLPKQNLNYFLRSSLVLLMEIDFMPSYYFLLHTREAFTPCSTKVHNLITFEFTYNYAK